MVQFSAISATIAVFPGASSVETFDRNSAPTP
jgi:hypothetical protein